VCLRFVVSGSGADLTLTAVAFANTSQCPPLVDAVQIAAGPLPCGSGNGLVRFVGVCSEGACYDVPYPTDTVARTWILGMDR
jgi:hypothetical protein